MKYAIVVSVFKTEFGPIVFKGNLADNIKAARELGYDAVELAVKNPESVDVEALKKILEEYSIPALTIGTGHFLTRV
jgi:sugar phosphate isomerase/epimerase